MHRVMQAAVGMTTASSRAHTERPERPASATRIWSLDDVVAFIGPVIVPGGNVRRWLRQQVELGRLAAVEVDGELRFAADAVITQLMQRTESEPQLWRWIPPRVRYGWRSS